MRRALVVLFVVSFATAVTSVSKAKSNAPGASDLVDLATINSHIRLDLRYATANNFTHQAVYPVARCYLQRKVAERLGRVQAALEKEKLGLKVFDCYRPLSVQKKFWALVPDERYVANPQKGSRHNRAAAVDLTLVDETGKELEMPTPWDDFSDKAHRDYSRLPAAAIANRARLEAAMKPAGFVGLPTEWWHFDFAAGATHELLDLDFESLAHQQK